MKRKPKKIEMLPINSIKSGPIRHRDFSEDVLNRIRKLWDRVKDYAPVKTLEQWELLFMRDTDGEIAIWEKMADAVEGAGKELGMDANVAFPTVLEYAGGMVKPADRAQSLTKEIVAICKRVGLTPSPVQIRRR